MRKVILLLVLVLILIIAILLIRRRRNEQRNFVGTSIPKNAAEEGRKIHGSQIDLILSQDETLLSYSILVKNLEKPVENVYFTVAGKRVKQISGPRNHQKGSNEMIFHGLWRSTDAKPFSAERVEQLKNGELSVSIELKEGDPVEIEINK